MHYYLYLLRSYSLLCVWGRFRSLSVSAEGLFRPHRHRGGKARLTVGVPDPNRTEGVVSGESRGMPIRLSPVNVGKPSILRAFRQDFRPPMARA